VRTEDHPIKYLDFEGVIPKGEYGGGTMIVWDRGLWTPTYDPRKSIAKGHLEFELKGERLKGRWHLVRMKRREREKQEQWLLIKASDEYERSASDPDVVLEETTSILSGHSNEDLAAADDVRVDHEGRAQIVKARKDPLPDPTRIRGARKGMLPLFVEPALAGASEQPPSGPHWVHEIKFDGYRMQARVDAGEVRLLTRTGLDWTDRFSSIATAVKDLELGSAMLDGEIVVEDAAGISNFNYLVTDLKAERQDRFRYYVVDLLYLEGTDLRGASFLDRKQMLKEALSPRLNGRIALSDYMAIDGATMLEHACRLGLEGIISKRADAPYRSGRGKYWLKSKCVQRQDFVVIGYVPSSSINRAVGSLVLGYYDDGGLMHAGRAGSGLSGEEAHALLPVLEAMRIPKHAFRRQPIEGADKDVRWVEPKLVAEIEYRGWSKDGVLKHATYQGLREDMRPLDIALEDASPMPKAPEPTVARLTHPDRVLWPEEGITKRGLADFYAEIADWILPHLLDRPLSLVRCPNGIAAQCFFAKHPWAGLTKGIRRVDVGAEQPMLAIDDLDGLMELVQGSVLEIHPWGATMADLERPDRLIIDLDPGDDVPWSTVVEGGREVRRRLLDLGLESFVKTTGGKGLHVIIPLSPSLEWAPAEAFCRDLVEAMAADGPQQYVTNMSKRVRKGHIFLDYFRNKRGATAVGAYSTRARPGAAVSTPLDWDELSEAVRSDHYRVDNLGRRLRNLKQDPWAELPEIRQKLPNAAVRGPRRPSK